MTSKKKSILCQFQLNKIQQEDKIQFLFDEGIINPAGHCIIRDTHQDATADLGETDDNSPADSCDTTNDKDAMTQVVDETWKNAVDSSCSSDGHNSDTEVSTDNENSTTAVVDNNANDIQQQSAETSPLITDTTAESTVAETTNDLIDDNILDCIAEMTEIINAPESFSSKKGVEPSHPLREKENIVP